MKNHTKLFKTIPLILFVFVHFYSRSQSACPLTATQTILHPNVCQNELAQVEFTITALGTPTYTLSYLENGASKTVSTVGSNSLAVVTVVTSTPGKVAYQLTQIQDANGCVTPLTIPADTLTINSLPQATLTGSGSACEDSLAPVLTFSGISGTPPFYFTFTINGGDASIVHSTTSTYNLPTSTEETGTFTYSLLSVTDKNCTDAVAGQTAIVSVDPNPQAAFIISPERVSLSAPTVTIDNFSIGVTNWKWDFGDSSISLSDNPISHTYKDTGTYKIKLIASNNAQCKDSTYQIVRVYQPLKLFVPNAFTPNGDSINDEFKAQGDGIVKFEMKIFDNHGQIAFTSNDINKGWDGKSGGSNPPPQTFVYVINLRALSDRHDYTYRGTVTIVR
jgi:gliding motility-associated-like protein